MTLYGIFILFSIEIFVFLFSFIGVFKLMNDHSYRRLCFISNTPTYFFIYLFLFLRNVAAIDIERVLRAYVYRTSISCDQDKLWQAIRN